MVPYCTGRVISPKDWQAFLGMTPQKGELTGVRSFFERPSSDKALAKRMLRAPPPSMRTFVKHTLWMIVSSMRGKHPVYGISAHWSTLLKVMGCSDQGRYMGSMMVLMMPLTAKTHREVSFLSRLFLEAARPRKIV